MDLKNTIDNTSKYKNDLKLARNKINDKIVSGGGTIANTISDVPGAIDKMLKGNYKKVAYIKPSYEEFYLMPDENLEITIKTNTDFIADKFIINFATPSSKNFAISNIFDVWNNSSLEYEVEYNYFEINLKSISFDKIILEFIPKTIVSYMGFIFSIDGAYLIE